MKKVLAIIFLSLGLCLILLPLCAQNDQASLLLELKKARASYDIALQNFDNDKKLLENDAISQAEYNQSKNELLTREVDYQKLLLQLISQQSYVAIEKAVKYRTPQGEKRVRITIRSTMEGNQDYLKQFEQHFDVFTPEMRSGKIYNIFVSLNNIEDQTIIGSPYEARIPSIDLGKSATVDFKLLRDVESIQVGLNYGGKKDQKNIYLEKDASTALVDIISSRFAQEADLGSSASFDLTLERYSNTDDIYQLTVLGLPRQISYDFLDGETSARLSQMRFSQGENIRKLSLRTYLPDRDDAEVVIDEPISFYAIILTKEVYTKVQDRLQELSEDEIAQLEGGKIRLELIPSGIGKIIVKAPSLYHEITTGDSVSMKIRIMNDGTRTIDNIRITSDNPLNWNTVIEPDMISSLEPGKELEVEARIIPPKDANLGAQEVKIKTEAVANNRRVSAEDKTIRIQVNASKSVGWTLILVLLLAGMVVGIVFFGIRISKR
jgi:NPCBM-associated, NEW3 domain of alpha-galactosidase